MLKKKYVKRAYIEEVYCDKCGAIMRHTGVVLTSYPCKYPFECTNPKCDGYVFFYEDERCTSMLKNAMKGLINMKRKPPMIHMLPTAQPTDWESITLLAEQ